MCSQHLQKGSNLASVQLRRKKAEARTITRVFLEQLLHLGPQTFKLQNLSFFFAALPLFASSPSFLLQLRILEKYIHHYLHKFVQGQILHLCFDPYEKNLGLKKRPLEDVDLRSEQPPRTFTISNLVRWLPRRKSSVKMGTSFQKLRFKDLRSRSLRSLAHNWFSEYLKCVKKSKSVQTNCFLGSQGKIQKVVRKVKHSVCKSLKMYYFLKIVIILRASLLFHFFEFSRQKLLKSNLEFGAKIKVGRYIVKWDLFVVFSNTVGQSSKTCRRRQDKVFWGRCATLTKRGQATIHT